jgi:ribonuclease BN (tRNA processing enzyme)
MKIVFLGTRGYIDAKTKRHRMHTSTLLIHRKKKVLIDCGEDWIGKIPDVDAILLTHSRPDHAYGLKKGALCPVWGTQETFRSIQSFPIERRILSLQKKTKICGITFEAFPVLHSIRAEPG